jgi:uncharacterized protein
VLRTLQKVFVKGFAVLLENATKEVRLLMSEIHEACKRGDLNRVRSILTTGGGAGVRSLDDTGHTPLHRAAESYDANCVKMIELLVASGASPDAKSRDGGTPLMRAASRHALAAASALIKAGADTNAKDDKGQTAIMHAVCDFQVEEIMDQVNKEERSLGEPHYWEIITLLLGAKANPNAKDNDGRSHLIHSVIFDQVDAVTALLKGGADPNGKDKKGWTPLMWSATAQNSGMAEILLGAGADAAIKNQDGYTAVGISVIQDKPAPVKALLNHQPADTREREKLLFDAIGWASSGVVELLLKEENVDVNVKGKFGETPLESALGIVISGRGDAVLNILRTVLAHGANPNQLNRFGHGDPVLDDALEHACRFGGAVAVPS